MAALSPVTLPEELIGEVLSFLSVKSLIRMKCVNKSWNTLISDPIFVKMHLKHSPRNTHFVVRSSDESANIFPISVTNLLKSWEKTITPIDHPYCRFHSKDLRSIVGSCNGLICLLDSNNVDHSLYFWNPATRTKSTKFGSIRLYNKYGTVKFSFGYDNSTDTYKVVLLTLKTEDQLVRTAVKVFTLGDNVWRDINCFPEDLVLLYPNYLVQYDSVYFSNSISWLVRHRYNCHVKNRTIEEYVIVSLDLGTETYSQLLLPRCCNENPFDIAPTHFVFMDCLCFSYDFEKTHFVIWQMKEFGVEESWTQLLKINYLDLNIAFKVVNYRMRLIPLCFSDNDALIFITNFGDQPILYDWRNNRATRTNCTNFGDKRIMYNDWYSATEYSVESLVSPY
ncbi:F-box/kelch-repeat protein [Trifolium repens]|nr:F-box/kelch-repeat protein [Trifolium repens]